MNSLKIIGDMKRWIVCYEDKDGDISNVWTSAETEEDAIADVKSEYWDIENIIYVTLM